MKTCKSCIREIETDATKCSYCQAYQLWYKNPQHYSLILMLPFLIFVFWKNPLFTKNDFIDFESKFTFVEEKVINMKRSNKNLITFTIKNNTEHKWQHINYEVISKHNGELLAAMTDSNYDWVIQPNSTSLITVEVPLIANANEWLFIIKDLKSDRF